MQAHLNSLTSSYKVVHIILSASYVWYLFQRFAHQQTNQNAICIYSIPGKWLILICNIIKNSRFISLFAEMHLYLCWFQSGNSGHRCALVCCKRYWSCNFASNICPVRWSPCFRARTVFTRWGMPVHHYHVFLF